MAILFWACAGAMAYVYVGYPLLLFLVSRVWTRPVAKAPVTPTVTMVIAAYNEEPAIAGRVPQSGPVTGSRPRRARPPSRP
jgi:hypothetical protein